MVRTQPSQGWYTGSTPVRAARAFFRVKRADELQRFQIHDSFMLVARVYKARPRKDRAGDDLIIDGLSFI